MWRVTWSADAALRAARAVVVVPGLFALGLLVVRNSQLALYAAFGGVATLIMVSFGGDRRDKAVAHLGLALAGSVLVTVGTVAAASPWLAVVTTVPVAFAVLFAGMAGPNAASGRTAALLAYVLSATSPADLGSLPARLAGWWLASAASMAAVLLIARSSPGGRLRLAVAGVTAELARYLSAAASGRADRAKRDDLTAAMRRLPGVFATAPYRPTGLAAPDRALSHLVKLLEWCVWLACDAPAEDPGRAWAAAADRRLLGAAGGVLGHVAGLLAGRPGQDAGLPPAPREPARAELARAEPARAASAAPSPRAVGCQAGAGDRAADAVRAQAIADTAREIATDAVAATTRGRLDLAAMIGRAAPRASLRSVWLRNAVRGAAGLALAVALAEYSGVEHGFWVVLGTLSVLRGSASATEATVARALAGTVAGVVIGSALLLILGGSPAALWVSLPFAVLAAAYSRGTAPFAAGQAAFTVTVLVLFNLLRPAGLSVGLERVTDVAIGCAVSLVVGVLFWPRGASALVGDDLSDAFRCGARYLTQSVDCALGIRGTVPDAAAATASGVRLDDSLRGYLAEQGSKRLARDDLWTLVASATQVRLTARSLARLPRSGDPRVAGPDPHPCELRGLTAELAGFYDQIAAQIGDPGGRTLTEVAVPGADRTSGCRDSGGARRHPGSGDHGAGAAWASEHLRHLLARAPLITAPALRMAARRRLPWWR